MSALRIVITLLALTLGGWMAFDGARALLVGDFVTPSSGPHAGQLGPWADLVAAAGIDPRSSPVKLLILAIGAAWLTLAIAYSARARGARAALAAIALVSAWYLPAGTVIGAAILLLLAVESRRPSRRARG